MIWYLKKNKTTQEIVFSRVIHTVVHNILTFYLCAFYLAFPSDKYSDILLYLVV